MSLLGRNYRKKFKSPPWSSPPVSRETAVGEIPKRMQLMPSACFDSSFPGMGRGSDVSSWKESVLVCGSVAVINTITKSNLGQKGLTGYSPS